MGEKEFECRICGGVFIRAGVAQKMCKECSRKYQREQRIIHGAERRKREKAQREAAARGIIPPKFSLAEVETAARKNNMHYGKYVAAWNAGTVEPPEKLTKKKKRGRK